MGQPSNSAWELYRVCEMLSGTLANGSVAQTLGKLLDTSPSSTEFYTVLGALSQRFDRIENFIRAANSPEQLKNLALTSTGNLRRFLLAEHLPAAWDQIRAQVFTQAHLQTFQMTSLMIGNDCRVSVPDADEKEEILERLESAASRLEQQNSPLADLLRLALATAIRMARRLDIYGIETLSEKLVELYSLNAQAEKTAEPEQKSAYDFIKNAIVACFLIVTASDAGLSAIENHYSRGEAAIEFIQKHIDNAPKLLPPPRTDDQNTMEA